MNIFTKKVTGNKGFTLIELLVVVAIIGILAATILASLGGARQRARTSRALSELSSMRAAAELEYNTSSGYPTDLFTKTTSTSGVHNLRDSLEKFVGNTTDAKGYVQAGGANWSYYLLTGSVLYCSDSSGYSGKNTGSTVPNSYAACTPSN